MKKLIIAVFAAAGLSAAVSAQEGAVNFDGLAVPMPKMERVQPAAAMDAIPGRAALLEEAAGQLRTKRSGGLLSGFIKASKKAKSRGSAKNECYEDCASASRNCSEDASDQARACFGDCSASFTCDPDDTACGDARSRCYMWCDGMARDLQDICAKQYNSCQGNCEDIAEEKSVKNNGGKAAAAAPARK